MLGAVHLDQQGMARCIKRGRNSRFLVARGLFRFPGQGRSLLKRLRINAIRLHALLRPDEITGHGVEAGLRGLATRLQFKLGNGFAHSCIAGYPVSLPVPATRS